jgi:hypothetical protein
VALLPNNNIPIKYGAVDRAGLRRANPQMAGMELGVTYLMALSSVELWFQEHAPEEVGLCIADEIKIKMLKMLNRCEYASHKFIFL